MTTLDPTPPRAVLHAVRVIDKRGQTTTSYQARLSTARARASWHRLRGRRAAVFVGAVRWTPDDEHEPSQSEASEVQDV